MNLYEILQNSDRVGEGMTHFERLFAQKVGGGKINEISGVPPLRYIGDGRPLTDYRIAGNTVQDGTPSPDAPVDVVGCGVWDETHQSCKLPLTVNGTEYPIFIGEVETTRRVKKLVLTGEESWALATTSLFSLPIPQTGMPITGSKSVECTHFVGTPSRSSYSQLYADQICVRSTGTQIWIRSNDISSVADFKSYLAAQYAAGTPVTVWYVLAEPETAIVNEPLMKIGDYADTVSFAQAGVTIPTVNGENVLDVPTEVKPSEVWIRGRIKEV